MLRLFFNKRRLTYLKKKKAAFEFFINMAQTPISTSGGTYTAISAKVYLLNLNSSGATTMR